MKLTHEQMAALKALGAASHGTFDPWRIAGDRNAALRQSILMGLTGAKATRAQSGVTAIRAALMRVADIDGAGLCEAAVNDRIMSWGAAAIA